MVQIIHQLPKATGIALVTASEAATAQI